MKVFGFVRNRVPMVCVITGENEMIVGPLMQVLSRLDVIGKKNPLCSNTTSYQYEV